VECWCVEVILGVRARSLLDLLYAYDDTLFVGWVFSELTPIVWRAILAWVSTAVGLRTG
jgi:hypothetical protein